MQNGANAIRTLIVKEIVATIEHLYLDEDNGHRNFFYQIMGGYFNEEEGEFQTGVHPQGMRWNFNEEEIIHAK